MAVINHAKREINAKLVFFGPPASGKGAFFSYSHQRIKPSLAGPLKSMSAGADTLLFFDYIPFETSCLDGYRIRFHLYTLTGPVTNPGTWKMILKGVDGLAFVTAAQDQSAIEQELRTLRSIMAGYGKNISSLPRLWLCPVSGGPIAGELAECFGFERRAICHPASGNGVLQALAQLSQEVLGRLRDEFTPGGGAATETGCMLPEPTTCSDTPGEATPVPVVQSDVALPFVQLSLGGETIFRVPLSVLVDGREKRYTLRVGLQLEEEGM